jgi:hypothetical protein
MKRSPGLRLCIDHLAYPDPNWERGSAHEQAWLDHLSALASEGSTIKLSGFGPKLRGQWNPAHSSALSSSRRLQFAEVLEIAEMLGEAVHGEELVEQPVGERAFFEGSDVHFGILANVHR